jgi:hypothetical protein
MGVIDRLIGGAVNLTTNVGKTAYNLGNYAYRYVMGDLGSFVPIKKQGAGRLITNMVEAVGRGGIRMAGGASRAVGNIVGGTLEGVPTAASVAVGAARQIGTQALGAATITGRAIGGMFKDDIDRATGKIVRDINNLWTGKRMKPMFGWGLVAGGLALGAGKGIAGGMADYSGVRRPSEIPSMTYDGLANSATGDLNFALHRLRRGG